MRKFSLPPGGRVSVSSAGQWNCNIVQLTGVEDSYALNKDSGEEFIIGVLMEKELFYRSFLPVLSADTALFKFFLKPRTAQIVRYMSEHTEAVTLKDIAARFAYHPNYVCYSSSSNFYKAFREYYHCSPQEHMAGIGR